MRTRGVLIGWLGVMALTACEAAPRGEAMPVRRAPRASLDPLSVAPETDHGRELPATSGALPDQDEAAATPYRPQLVVIDPGHGGEDRGSPGLYGLWEGEVALDLARRVKVWLARLRPSVRTRLTRDSDVYLALEERAAMANALGAELFVSLHLNAATGVVEHGGVATFVLDVDNDRNVLRLAARENGTRTSDVSPMQFLVGSLARAEQQGRSLRLAEHVQQSTLLSGRRYLSGLADRGVKRAMFHVLVGAQMPAILLEASFLTQPAEAVLLTESAYRDALAEGVARGLAHYLSES
jgi:N-acetylmuramoyl-L-alanine amidase